MVRFRLERDAYDHVGEVETVCGVVVSPTYAADARGQPTFLNLDRPYPDQIFTAVIWGEDRAHFGTPEIELADKRICVTGTSELYKGRAEIILHDPRQLSRP